MNNVVLHAANAQGRWVHSQILPISTERKHAHNVLAVVSDLESDFFLGLQKATSHSGTIFSSILLRAACSFNLKAPPSRLPPAPQNPSLLNALFYTGAGKEQLVRKHGEIFLGDV